MHFLNVLVLIFIATLLAVIVSSKNFDDYFLKHFDGATVSDSSFKAHKTGTGLAIAGGVVFLGLISALTAIELGFDETRI
jgi:hypothetical protein